MPVLPKIKLAFTPSEDHNPYLKVGKFVKVELSSTTKKYSPDGYGYIQETFGVGLAAYYTIKYTLAQDSGRTYKGIHLAELTPFSPS